MAQSLRKTKHSAREVFLDTAHTHSSVLPTGKHCLSWRKKLLENVSSVVTFTHLLSTESEFAEVGCLGSYSHHSLSGW